MLNSYNADNAEFGLRSDKLELLAGSYKLIGYYLYDKLNKQIYAGTPSNYQFSVVAGGLKETRVVCRCSSPRVGQLQLVKHGLPETEAASRANSGYEDYRSLISRVSILR